MLTGSTLFFFMKVTNSKVFFFFFFLKVTGSKFLFLFLFYFF